MFGKRKIKEVIESNRQLELTVKELSEIVAEQGDQLSEQSKALEHHKQVSINLLAMMQRIDSIFIGIRNSLQPEQKDDKQEKQ